MILTRTIRITYEEKHEADVKEHVEKMFSDLTMEDVTFEYENNEREATKAEADALCEWIAELKSEEAEGE